MFDLDKPRPLFNDLQSIHFVSCIQIDQIYEHFDGKGKGVAPSIVVVRSIDLLLSDINFIKLLPYVSETKHSPDTILPILCGY